MPTPAVSVVMPAYNPGKYLELAVASIVEQQFADWELIVVDDGSDEDLSWVGSIGPQVRLLRTTRQGVSVARNVGITAAAGDFIAFLDQDDRWFPTKLERQLEVMDNNVVFSYTAFDLIDVDGTRIGPGYGREVGYRDMLAGEAGVLLSTVIVRGDALARSGLFHPMLRVQQDADLVMKVARSGRSAYVPSVEAEYRLHGTNASRDYWRAITELILLYQLAEIEARSVGDEAALRALSVGKRRARRTYAFQAFDAAREALHEGRTSDAAVALGRSLRLSPGAIKESAKSWLLSHANFAADSRRAAYGDPHPSSSADASVGSRRRVSGGASSSIPPSGGRRARLCVISPFVPVHNPTHAGGLYLYESTVRLARSFELTVLVHDTAANRSAAEHLDWSVHLFPTRPPERVGRMSTIRQRLQSAWWGLPHDVELDSPCWSIIEKADLVAVHWTYFLGVIEPIKNRFPETPVVAVPYDVATQESERRASRSFRGRLKTWRVAVAERRLLNRVERVAVFSAKDADLLARLGVRTGVSVLDPPLEVPNDEVLKDAAAARASGLPLVLLTGAMWRDANWRSAQWFIEEVWPHISNACPDARFLVAGADPPQALVDSSSDSVSITGWQDDLSPLYRDASVFVAPLLWGAGLKFKVPQAMLFALPVVATTIAAEGVVEHSGPAAFGAVTDDPIDMANAIISLLRDPVLARAVGARGREWARHHYSFEASLRREAAAYRALVSSGCRSWSTA